MTIALISLGLLFILVLVWNFMETSEGSGFSTIALALSSIWFTLCIIAFNRIDKPTALDVYRGSTTLQITYQDSIPIDSVVVFKNKEK